MWAEGELPEDDPVRQGDLLEGVLLPTLKLPLRETSKDGVIRPQDVMVVDYTKTNALVVSQCCSVNNEYVAVARVRPLGGMNESQEAALLAEEPPADEERSEGTTAGYMMDLFRLQPLEGVIEEQPGRYQVADLARTTSFWGECEILAPHRRGRMTVQARRLLRIKLGLFWSRPEQSDAEALEALGLPSGLSG